MKTLDGYLAAMPNSVGARYMRRFDPIIFLSLFLSLLSYNYSHAEIKLEGKTRIPANSVFDLRVTGDVDKGAVIWDFLNGEKSLTLVPMKIPVVTPQKDKDGKDLPPTVSYSYRLIGNGPTGSYDLRVRVFRNDKDGGIGYEEIKDTIVIGEGKPKPDPIDPPDPDVDPTPTPSVQPIAGEGFRVLIIEDERLRAKLPPSQLSILESKEVRDYLKAKCAKDDSDDGKAYRIWSKDIDPSAESKSWQDAFKRPAKSYPWRRLSTS
jgi:hypothetical protein